MIDSRHIRRFSERLDSEFQPERVILFGSHARGKARPDSDVDLLVIMPFKGHSALKAAEMVRRLDPPFAVDLLVRTAGQIKRRLALDDFFLRDVMSTGRVLYEARHARMGRKG